MSTKKRKKKVPILSRAEKLKRLGIKIASLTNRRVDAQTRKPTPKIDLAFIPFQPRGPSRVVPGTGSNLSKYRKKK